MNVCRASACLVKRTNSTSSRSMMMHTTSSIFESARDKGSRWRSTKQGRLSLRELKLKQTQESINEVARENEIKRVLREKQKDKLLSKGEEGTSATLYLRPEFSEQLQPLTMDIQPIIDTTGSKSSAQKEAAASPGGGGKPVATEQDFVTNAFNSVIRDDIVNTLITALVRHSHIFMYAEDPWSEGYSVPLVAHAAAQMNLNVRALDIPDWAVLAAGIDPVLEDLTIVSHPYTPPPDLEVEDRETSGSGSRGMSFFAGISRRRSNDEGYTVSEQLDPASSKSESENNTEMEEGEEDGKDNPRSSLKSSRLSSTTRYHSRSSNSDPDTDEVNDPELSREMMSNPLNRDATERLDRVLSDFISSNKSASLPSVIVLKHVGDLLNTRIGYTLLSRLIGVISKHNRQADTQPVILVGMLHPSWFNFDAPPPGIPPFDINPATPLALMPKDDKPTLYGRGLGEIVEGLMGGGGSSSNTDDTHRGFSSLSGGKVGVHLVQMGADRRSGRSSTDTSNSPPEELPLFARIGIPPPSSSVLSSACNMQSSKSEPVFVGSLRQAMVANQCLDRNARVIRNICLLYKIPGLELTESETKYLNSKIPSNGEDTKEMQPIFSRSSLYEDDAATQILPKQPRKSTWHLDYRPLVAMLRSMPDDVARRYFFGETFLHRWVSLAQALAVKDKLNVEEIYKNPAALQVAGQNALLTTKHLTAAWSQALESHRALKDGLVSSDRQEEKEKEKGEGGNTIDRLHRMVDFSEIGVGRRISDDLDVVPLTATSHKHWSAVGKLLDPNPDDVDGSDASSGHGNHKYISAVPPPQRRIQLAKKNLSEYEQRLVGSIVDPQSIPTGFGQVCAKPETVNTLQEIITLPMLRPEYFSKGVLKRYGISGILLFGPPGTGKTMLAKAVAKESGSVVLNIRASDIYDKYVGEGEKLAEAVFLLARKLAPCVIFIDEVDALFSARSSGETNKFRRDIMNQIMAEWDGLNTQHKKGGSGETAAQQVMVMAATNRPFDLDDAILRRLPRRILIDLPDEADRAKILEIHLKGEELESDIELRSLAKQTESFSGSDLKNLCVAAALAALRERVKEEVGANGADSSSSSSEKSVIEQLKHIRRALPAASQNGKTIRGNEPQIRLAKRHFDAALKKVAPSSSDQMESLVELRKWDKMYGDGAQERNRRGYTIGFLNPSKSTVNPLTGDEGEKKTGDEGKRGNSE